MTTRQIILSVTADDRPGLVDALSTVIADHDGNWLGSSMARLGGQFAGIVQTDIPIARYADFEAAIAALKKHAISVAIRADTPIADTVTSHAAHLSLTGADHPGIVRDVSHVLAEHGVSIDQLHTQLFAGSMSGQAMFSAEADMALPDGLDAATLHHALEAIAGDLLVEINLKVD